MLNRTIPLLAVCLLLSGSTALAGIGKTWTTSGAEQFAAGKLEGVSVLSTGDIRLAPETQEIDGLEAEFVWDVEVSNDGTVYVATGSPAAIYTVKATRAELLHKTEQQHVLSVLPLPDGSVLAGTAPEGIIYRISRHGDVSTFVDLEDHYVWDMALGPFNRIYCATGPEGRLIELNRAGEVTERLKVKQKNLMCVTVDKEGTVYTGTDPDGYIYRLERDGKASVLYDAEESEVHDIVVDSEGRIYACTAQSKPSRQGGPPGPPEPGPPGGLPSSGPRPGAPAAHNSMYRIVPGKGAVRIARFDKMFVLSLVLVEGRLLAGTGSGGRLMAVDEDGLSRILTEFDTAHVTAMAATPTGDVIVGTSNAGGLWRLKGGCRSSGTFISKAFDAGYLSRWGRGWWQEKTQTGQSIRIKLRTGNSGEPDEHWSEWSSWGADSAGQVLDVPMGRFAQFSAELKTRPRTGTPSLLQVRVSYRQANRKPSIQDLTLDGASLLRKKTEGRPSSREGREPSGPPRPNRPREGSRAEKRIAWKVTDPNGDELIFDLYYRGMDESDWKAIEEGLRGETSCQWNTARVPDGRYLLKLVARDDPARPKEEALSDQRVSSPLLVDNRRPTVQQLSADLQPDGSHELTGLAQDEHSNITSIEVSHNAGDWNPVFPTDGILDSREEAFAYRTEVLEPGEHVFVFSATDSNMNTGTGKLVVTVQRAEE